jgi:hypothetical protein
MFWFVSGFEILDQYMSKARATREALFINEIITGSYVNCARVRARVQEINESLREKSTLC